VNNSSIPEASPAAQTKMAIGHDRHFPTLLLIPAGTTLRFRKLPPPKTLNLSITHDMQQNPRTWHITCSKKF
jgi:hypothetical protein